MPFPGILEHPGARVDRRVRRKVYPEVSTRYAFSTVFVLLSLPDAYFRYLV